MLPDSLIEKIVIYLQSIGINPIYFFTIICILVTASYWRQFKDWDSIEYWRKGLAGSALFASIVLSIFSLLGLFGIIDL